jgi:[FeFe] hydrogenase H-cluster maturation GTPase HydF
MRLHIGIFGRRNVGKSSLLNALTRQEVSIVSESAGTTTDPVEKPMELLPLGPVQFIDTAGIDDVGALGSRRVERTRRIFDRTDLAILVADGRDWGGFEEEILTELSRRDVPVVVALNKSDLQDSSPDLDTRLRERRLTVVRTAAASGAGMADLQAALIASAPDDFVNTPSIMGDLVPPGRPVILVVPIDKEAPKGRLILPQVQSIRDILDHDGWCLVVKEHELKTALDQLRQPPALVVTDSQAFQKVAADSPPDIPLTSFSILFARFKGDLGEYARGVLAVDRLRDGDSVLVAEACSHHPIEEDIGRVKIPLWLNRYVGGRLDFHHVQGHDFPEDLAGYRLVIQCGGCMINRREVLSRIWRCRSAGIPVTNYGLAIAYSLGIFERAMAPFPDALELYHRLKSAAGPPSPPA